jgi:N-acetyl-anhydromuramyl-L-alanine amidase AmpD
MANKTVDDIPMEGRKMKCCFFCGGSGYWQDDERKQTLFCPICRSEPAEMQARSCSFIDTWCSDSWPEMPAKHWGPMFQINPNLLVIHSGSKSEGVAEFFQKIGQVKYGDRMVKVSTHLAWCADGFFCQCVPFDRVAWHCGGSRFRGERRLNFLSIGIELPGPWDGDRSDAQLKTLRKTVRRLKEIVPSLLTVVRHSDIDARKRDPGPGFKWECLDGLGLNMPFRQLNNERKK